MRRFAFVRAVLVGAAASTLQVSAHRNAPPPVGLLPNAAAPAAAPAADPLHQGKRIFAADVNGTSEVRLNLDVPFNQVAVNTNAFTANFVSNVELVLGCKDVTEVVSVAPGNCSTAPDGTGTAVDFKLAPCAISNVSAATDLHTLLSAGASGSHLGVHACQALAQPLPKSEVEHVAAAVAGTVDSVQPGVQSAVSALRGSVGGLNSLVGQTAQIGDLIPQVADALNTFSAKAEDQTADLEKLTQ